MIVPINLAGPTGDHRSVQFGDGLTQNFYIEERDGRLGMFDFPGNKAFGTCSGPFRGHHVMADVLYKVCGGSLYSVSSLGAYTELGSVPGAGFCIFADDGENLFFVNGTKLYQYDGAIVAEIPQTVVTNPGSIAYINRQFILSGDNGLFATSDVGDGATYNALNFAEAESAPDPLIRTYIFNQLAYQLGGKGTELWYNTGTGNPPFARQDTALVNVGIAGRAAVTNSDQYMYWLGDDKKVHQAVGASKRTITSPEFGGGMAAANVIERLTTVSDCIASHFVLEGQDFVLFHFPTDDKALLFSETFGYWVSLDWIGASVINVYDKNLVSDKSNGNTYELDLDTFTDNGAVRERIRTLPSFTGKLINHSGRVLVKKLRMNMQLGVGLATGTTDPKLMCEFSPDGGHTWQAEKHVSIGELGDYVGPIDFWDFANGYDVRARIRCTDPVFVSLFDGEVDLEAAGF